MVCMRRLVRCAQESPDFLDALEKHGCHVGVNAELTFLRLRAICPLDLGIIDRQLKMGASSLEVRASILMRSAAIDPAPPPLARGHASEGLSQHLALRSRKSGPHAHTPSSHEPRASPRPARWQDASFWRSGRI